jgi:hypothetical protein
MTYLWFPALADDFSAREPITTFGYGARSYLSLQFGDNTTIEMVIPTEDATTTVRYDFLTGAISQS